MLRSIRSRQANRAWAVLRDPAAFEPPALGAPPVELSPPAPAVDVEPPWPFSGEALSLVLSPPQPDSQQAAKTTGTKHRDTIIESLTCPKDQSVPLEPP